MAGIGPDDLRIPQLLGRIKTGEIKELILATNPNMEGEATAMYITQKIKDLGLAEGLKITRIGRGIADGGGCRVRGCANTFEGSKVGVILDCILAF